MPFTIRPLDAADEDAWRGLWADYLIFYEKDLPEHVTRTTWAKLMDPACAYWGLVAEATPEVGREAGDQTEEGERLLGFALNLTHPSTWSVEGIVYLEDLFVTEQARGQGIGRALITAAVETCRAQGWRAYYWQTHDDNHTARTLYDRLTGGASNWVKYEIALP